MMFFYMLGILLTLFIIFNGLYYLVLKRNKNRNSSILGYSFLIAGTVGLLITISFLN
ncbi:hypothetical protein ACQUWN_21015 [Rossellomorea aquimaris]|uniref:hypothetical protein n=1 Tax=Rossellomorea TaxID=2837508 RepID=UPI001653B3B5|nr:hypothetical protein [Rossellomorea vietnamensis]